MGDVLLRFSALDMSVLYRVAERGLWGVDLGAWSLRFEGLGDSWDTDVG